MSQNNCGLCSKVVYPMEKVVVDGTWYHKPCLKCNHCGNVLTVGKFAALEGKFYCKPHFKQLFALKGNYTDGFSGNIPEHYLTINGDEAVNAPASAVSTRKNTGSNINPCLHDERELSEPIVEV